MSRDPSGTPSRNPQRVVFGDGASDAPSRAEVGVDRVPGADDPAAERRQAGIAQKDEPVGACVAPAPSERPSDVAASAPVTAATHNSERNGI